MNLKVLLNRSLIILLIFALSKLYSYNIATHMYISSRAEFVDQWREFDPDFADAIDPSNNYPQYELVKKFYLLGTTLPDLLDYKNQEQVRNLINWLYEHRDDGKEIRILLSGPLYIDDETHNLVQDSIIFNGKTPNTNLEKLWEMVNYAREHNWSPYEKSLIYGAYTHVVEDLLGHMITQPSLFGYGYSILGDSANVKDLGEEFEAPYEVYTPSYIDDWNFIKTLYSVVVVNKILDSSRTYSDTALIKYMVTTGTPIKPKSFDFMDFVSVTGMGGVVQWRNVDYTPVAKFVEAANAVQYAGTTLTQERLEAYLEGWGIANFFLMGWEWNDGTIKNLGGIVAHLGTWSSDSLVNFMHHIGDEYWRLELVDNIVAEDLINWVSNGIAHYLLVPLLKFIYFGFVSHICHLDHPFPYYTESAAHFQSAWACVSDKPEIYYKMLNILESLEQNSTYKKPHLRETYFNELDRIRLLIPIIGTVLRNGPDALNYKMLNTLYGDTVDIYKLSRKAGISGALDSVPGLDYYDQPGIIDMHFEKDGRYIYTAQEIPLESEHGGISLAFDVVTFGQTKIQISKSSTPQFPIKYVEIPRVDRVRDEVDIDYNTLSDSLFPYGDTTTKELAFVVMTKKKDGDGYTTMLNSNYREAFTRPEVGNNIYYDSLFIHGNPVRTSGKDPLSKPKLYWPYTIQVKPGSISLRTPRINSEEYDAENNKIIVSFNDLSKYNTEYIIRRYNITRNFWNTYEISDTVGIKDVTRTFEDTAVNLWEEYIYHIKAENDTYNLESNEVSDYVLAAPYINTGTQIGTGAKRFVYTNGKYMAVYAKGGDIYYAESPDGLQYSIQRVNGNIRGSEYPTIAANDRAVVIAFRSNNNIYYVANEGSGWSTPVHVDDEYHTNDFCTAPALTMKADTIIIVYREHFPEPPDDPKSTDTYNHLTARIITLDRIYNNTRIDVLNSDDDLKNISVGGYNKIRILGENKRGGNKIELYYITPYSIAYEGEVGHGNSPMLSYNNGYYYLSWVEGNEQEGNITTMYIYGDEWGRPINTGQYTGWPSYPYIAGNNNGKWWIVYEPWDSAGSDTTIQGIWIMTLEPRGVWDNKKIITGHRYNLTGTYPQAIVSEYTSGFESRTVVKMWFTIPEKSRSYYYEKDISGNTVSPFTDNIEVVRKRLMIEGGNIIPKGRDIVINYYAPAMEKVKIELYDVNGRRVETIVNEKSGENGIYSRKIKTGDLKRGVYFIKYRSRKELKTEQIIITG